MTMEENQFIRGGQGTDPKEERGAGNIISEYIVEEKDTLDDIANKYGLSVDELLAANQQTISNRSEMVAPGTKIMIPSKGNH